jgi:hypothetical protein
MIKMLYLLPCVIFNCNYKKDFKIKYVIYETYDIIYNIWKFYTKY